VGAEVTPLVVVGVRVKVEDVNATLLEDGSKAILQRITPQSVHPTAQGSPKELTETMAEAIEPYIVLNFGINEPVRPGSAIFSLVTAECVPAQVIERLVSTLRKCVELPDA
jgi:hypothetical protein